jgi:drug/metabolite transporter (DMT)-like permease
VFWGLSFVATKLALRELSPATLVFVRFALGAALLLGILAARGAPLVPPRAEWLPLMAMGLLGVFVHPMLQATALTMTTAIHTGWLIGVIPIWSALLAAIVLGEGLGALQIVGLALGFAGVALVVSSWRFARWIAAHVRHAR